MRNFHRLPPLLRITGIVGLLLALAAVGLLTQTFLASLSSFPNWPLKTSVIGMNLGMLGAACSVVVQTYSTRFHLPAGSPLPLDSWHSQLRTLLLLAALPLCALALAIVIPPMESAFPLVILVSTLAALTLLGAHRLPIVRGLPVLH